MKVIKNYNSLFWLQNILLSTVISIAAVFCVPNIMNWSIGKENVNMLAGVGFLIACLVCFAVLVWMSYARHQNSLIKVIGRIVVTFAMEVLFIMIISCLCGVIASLLYYLLKDILLLDQIKGVIDFITTVVSIVFIPLLCNVFWKVISEQEGIVKRLKAGITIKGKQYTSLLAFLLIAFAIGVIITTIFHFVSSNILTDIVKVVLFSGVGTVVLSGSEQILR